MENQAFTESEFQAYLAQHRLMGARCAACGALHVPPRPMCAHCFGDAMAWTELAGIGTLLAFTAVHIAPTAMVAAGYGRDNPYVAGIVQLGEGPAVSAQIVGVDATRPEEIAVGTPLRATFIDRGEGDDKRTFLAFEPDSSDR